MKDFARLIPLVASVAPLLWGGCAQPYQCGVKIACTCACRVCDARSDGGASVCTSERVVENPVLVCGPLEVGEQAECEPTVAQIVDAGTSPCTQKCELALQGSGLDVLGCSLTGKPDNPNVQSSDEAECRVHPKVDLE